MERRAGTKMEGSVELSSFQDTAWDCDDSQHGRDVASSLKKRRIKTESPVSSSSLSSDLAGNNYDVFLSFRGPDTRKSFTDFLYKSLTDAGIRVFRDDDELPVGEEIKPALIEAIKQSKVLIPIISRDYASSRSCLMELVQILECKQTMSRETIPIFYEIELSDLKDQRNSFEKSFLAHEMKGVDCETIQKWKVALEEIGRLKGFETTKIDNGNHPMLIDEIIPIVLQKLKKGLLTMRNHLVGIDHHVQVIMRKLGIVHRDGQVIEICGSDVRVLGIYGIGGVGKTSLAKVVYYRLFDGFQCYSYLKEIRELYQHDGTLSLQNQLISDLRKGSGRFRCSNDARVVLAEQFRNKQVLILLDDVDDFDQLDAVVGELSWFGPGSRIIVTSRRRDILLKFKEAETFEVEPMEEDKALQLFSKRAFGRDYPIRGFESLSRNIVSASGCLPLALEVMGSHLFRKSEGIWEDMLHKLKNAPWEQVEFVLKISYDALEITAKEIFLDIACFLIGKDERIAFYMWEDCGPYFAAGIEELLIMSLVKIGENKELLMHDLLRTLGRKLVLSEHSIPGKRSRLWVHSEALSTLHAKGTRHVEALCLNLCGHPSHELRRQEFENMPNLRFLQLDHADITGDFANVFSQLRWLCWRGCPRRLQATNFHMENLTILDLSWSKVTKDWEGWDQMKMEKLRVLDLTGCADLLVTPMFSGCKNLAILILEQCSQLVKIDHSIGDLKHLVSLNLKFCTELSMLPVEVGHLTALQELLMDGTSVQEIPVSIGHLEQLKTLSASNCFSLSQLPRTICQLTNISLLSLDGTSITALPDSIGKLVRLENLSLKDCRQIRKLPNSIGNIGRSLVKLDVSGTGIFKFPNSLKNLQNLKVLRMDSCFFSEFPRNIEELTSLEEIHASWCRSLEGGIPSEIRKLHNLRLLRLRHSTISSIPAEIHQLSNLQILDLLHCDMIKELPRLLSGITVLYVDNELKSSHLP